MSQYDVHRLRSGELVLDCQANFLEMMGTRLVIPLVDPEDVPDALPRLHPVFDVAGNTMLLATHLAAAIPTWELRARVVSLAQHDFTIGNALDFLLTGV
jgi:toxin CcdB